MDNLVGTTIAGKYLVKRRLGEGGMGAVFEAEHVEIGNRVALKVINAAYASSPEIRERFRREARAASKVESESIVHVFDVGDDPTIGLYMVMEFLSGEDVATRLARERRLAPAVAVRIATQTTRALVKAHAAGVIHRDLKPANLFLTEREDGSLLVKILDFGISKLTRDAPTGHAATPTLTRAGAVIGTAQYMSPEQAQGLAVDPRTDVWSLGAVLYEMLAGEPPYAERATYEQTIIQIVTQRPRPLGDCAPSLPYELIDLVHAALTPEVEQRLADCGTFARRLSELAQTLGDEVPTCDAMPSTTPATSAVSTPRPLVQKTGEGVELAPLHRPSRSAWLIGVATAALLPVTVGGIFGVRAFWTTGMPASGIVESAKAPSLSVTPPPQTPSTWIRHPRRRQTARQPRPSRPPPYHQRTRVVPLACARRHHLHLPASPSKASTPSRRATPLPTGRLVAWGWAPSTSRLQYASRLLLPPVRIRCKRRPCAVFCSQPFSWPPSRCLRGRRLRARGSCTEHPGYR